MERTEAREGERRDGGGISVVSDALNHKSYLDEKNEAFQKSCQGVSGSRTVSTHLSRRNFFLLLDYFQQHRLFRPLWPGSKISFDGSATKLLGFPEFTFSTFSSHFEILLFLRKNDSQSPKSSQHPMSVHFSVTLAHRAACTACSDATDHR